MKRPGRAAARARVFQPTMTDNLCVTVFCLRYVSSIDLTSFVFRFSSLGHVASLPLRVAGRRVCAFVSSCFRSKLAPRRYDDLCADLSEGELEQKLAEFEDRRARCMQLLRMHEVFERVRACALLLPSTCVRQTYKNDLSLEDQSLTHLETLCKSIEDRRKQIESLNGDVVRVCARVHFPNKSFCSCAGRKKTP